MGRSHSLYTKRTRWQRNTWQDVSLTDDQFNDIVLQENRRAPDGSRIVPPFDEITQGQRWSLPNVGVYDCLLRLEDEQGYPVLTFTATRDDLDTGPPSEAYVKMIASGLRETYPDIGAKEVRKYLLRAEGVREVLSADQVDEWVDTG